MPASEVATVGLPSQGFKLEIAEDSAGVPGVYAEIGFVRTDSLALPDSEEAFHEYINNSSPGGGTERTPKNQRTTGPTTFSVTFAPSNPVQIALFGYKENRTRVWLRVTSPDAGYSTASDGWIQKCAPKMGDDVQMLEVAFMPQQGEKAGTFA